ncbi:MAG TPA: hypothetical protein VIQ31_25565, partial [Phormidium sp.]
MTTIKHHNAELTGNSATHESLKLISSQELNKQARHSLQEDQQIIYSFFLKLVRKTSAEMVLQEFRKMFIEPIYDLKS